MHNMIQIHKKRRGQSTIEFAALIMFLLAALIVFQKYIVRGFSGKWKNVGDSMGQGRIYDPNKTIECAAGAFFDGQTTYWYDQKCFELHCEQHCLWSTKTRAACETCMSSTCATAYCSE